MQGRSDKELDIEVIQGKEKETESKNNHDGSPKTDNGRALVRLKEELG